MTNWVKAKGVVVVEPYAKRIALSLGFDFINYYAWILEHHYKEAYHYPKHGAHVTIANEVHHKNINYKKAKQFAGKWVEFEYSVDFCIGGARKGFKNFWLKVRSPEIEKIKKELEIYDGPGYLGLHATIAHSKGGVRKFQPKIIEIKL